MAVFHDESLVPQGYRLTSEFQYSINLIKVIAFISPLVVVPLFILADNGVFLPLTRGELNIVVIFTIFSPYWIRGIIQRSVGLLFGYRLSLRAFFALRLPSDFSVKTGGYRPCFAALMIALAPLSLYLALLIPLLLNHRGTLATMLTFVLLMNLFPTVSDVYFAGWLLTKPRGSLLYMKRQSALLFEPLPQDEMASLQPEVEEPEHPQKRRQRWSHRRQRTFHR